MALFSRSFRRRFFRRRTVLLILVVFLFLDTYIIASYRSLPKRTAALPPHLKDEKIFIVSIFRNSEYMLRLYWSSALLRLVEHLGPQNVFVSIIESGSQEDTKGALRDLERSLNELGVENRISLGITSEEQYAELLDVPGPEEDRTGWIFTGRGEKGWEVRRIPYLANLRNRAMEPLSEMEHRRKFERVLWINDVIFTTEDVTTLLATRDGDYAAVCALDFSKSAETYYDTFALRDSLGHKTATLTYPYFQSSASRSALYSFLPIPVESCWNGIISMAAAPFYPTPASAFSTSRRPALNFRGVPDSLAKHHLEGSECCLIHADNPLSSKKGIWLNPNVRVAFNATTYSKVNRDMEIRADIYDIVDGSNGMLGSGTPWPHNWELVRGVWLNRYARWTGWVQGWIEQRIVRGRVKKWAENGKNMNPPEDRVENGVICLVNEMQVLFENGWQHV